MLTALFNEELGAVLQIDAGQLEVVVTRQSRSAPACQTCWARCASTMRTLCLGRQRTVLIALTELLQTIWGLTSAELQCCATTPSARKANST